MKRPRTQANYRGKIRPQVRRERSLCGVNQPADVPDEGGRLRAFIQFVQELLDFDGVCAISEDSRAALADYWAWLGVSRPPPVVAIPLGIHLPKGGARSPERAGAGSALLSHAIHIHPIF